MLDNVFERDIFGYEKEEEEFAEDECSTYYKNLKSNESFTHIENQLNKRYIVDTKPICNAYSICYNVTYKSFDTGFISMKQSINKGETHNHN